MTDIEQKALALSNINHDITQYPEQDDRDDRIEALEAALREVFEEWAGSEGFIPETAPEGYLLQLTKRMADIARAALEG